MKNLNFLAFLLLISHFTLAQNIDECRKVVKLTIESINNKSADSLIESLADDFSIAGQKGDVAKLVLNQLLSQLGETVKSYKQTNQNKLDKELELKYSIEYEKMGIKEAVFIFNENNLLRELNLFKMQVKKMSGESKVIKNSKDVIEIPFTMAGKLIVVDVILNGKERKFILDSGSPKVILNSNYILMDSTRTTISSSKGVSGNISSMDIEKVESLDFNGIQLMNQEVITIDLSHLEEELGYNFYGLIGYELIKDYDIIFDYKRQILTFIATNTYEEYRSKNLLNSQMELIPFELQGHIPKIKVKINDQIFNFGIDCGAESNLIDDDLFQTLKKATCNIRTDELIGADNNRKKVKKGKIKRMEIGHKSFIKLNTLFTDISHLNEGYKLDLDGLIGYPVLSKQKTLISFRRKELIFLE